MIQAGSAVRVNQCREMRGDDFLKNVRVVRVMPGMWRVYTGGEKGGGIQVEGPKGAAVCTEHAGMWPRLA